MMAADVRPGWVLAATWVTGELEGNFSTMMTSCCICSVNIMGVCRRRYCSGHTPEQRRGRGGAAEAAAAAAVRRPVVVTAVMAEQEEEEEEKRADRKFKGLRGSGAAKQQRRMERIWRRKRSVFGGHMV